MIKQDIIKKFQKYLKNEDTAKIEDLLSSPKAKKIVNDFIDDEISKTLSKPKL
ncbi:MAG: hypothetical protein PHY73_02035 [Candidatus Omnitrophica bacterium]|nr:hypothetical protein [Candidatus Omnitrophota bacterium]